MIQKIAIVGMGALGLLYADQLSQGLNTTDAVEFIMDKKRAERHAEDIYTINGIEKHFRVVNCEDATPADLVIVAVKYTNLDETIRVMANSVGPNTIIMSVLNGVTSEKILAQKYGMERFIFTVAQGMDVMREGAAVRYTQCGKLHIGVPTAEVIEKQKLNTLCGTGDEKENADILHLQMQKNLEEITDLFEKTKLPHVVESDIMYRLWFKYMLNIGINQTCMVFDTNYQTATTPGEESYEKMLGAMREIIPIAQANGVMLTEADVQKCIEIEKTLTPEGYPSMAQDRKAKRKSEVDMFAGEVIRVAATLGIDVPYNKYYYDRVQEIESLY